MRRRLVLLGAQALCLGLTSVFLVVGGTSVFLSRYGPGLLPYAYLAVAVVGVAVSSGMTHAQRRLSLPALAVTVVAVFATLVAAAWALLSLAGLTWVTFPLVVLFPLWIPVGFVLVGAQAGRLLDVRALKAYFPRVVAGFGAGFALGGLLAARLVSVLGGPEDLLLVDSVVALVFLALVVGTARTFPEELRARPVPPAPSDVAPPEPGTRRLLGNRLVVVLLGYQLLSAAVSQLLDFLVWHGAAERYPDPADLARFLGVFGAVINVTGLVFVFTVAGVLLSRYGLRLGLAANPVGVLVLVVASTVSTVVAGAGGTVTFLLLCAQQVVDISLTDGTTRGSVNAAYQALPPRERLAAQTRVEGVGTPLAVGLVGLLLLVWTWLHASVAVLLVTVLLLTAAWLVLAVDGYRLYGVNLRRALSRRAWDPVALRLDDDASRAVVAGLLDSADPRDVAVGLDALRATAPEAAADAVRRGLRSADDRRRDVAVQAARRFGLVDAATTVLGSAQDTSRPDETRAAAVRAAAALGCAPGELDPLLADASTTVRTSAAVALLQVRSTDVDAERVEALLRHPDPATVDATLIALADLPHPRAVPALVRLAGAPRALSALPDALVAHGAHLQTAATAALDDPGRRLQAVRLVRAIGRTGTAEADAWLVRLVDHPDLDVRDTALRELRSGDRALDPDVDVRRVRDALDTETRRACRALDALAVLDGDPSHVDLCRALRDDLAATSVRVSSLLGLLHGRALVSRAVTGMHGPERALALETLEVSLDRGDAVLAAALLDPVLAERERRARLEHHVRVEERDGPTWLDDLARDPLAHWCDPWLRAAAVWALARTGGVIPPSVVTAVVDPDPLVAETARALVRR